MNTRRRFIAAAAGGTLLACMGAPARAALITGAARRAGGSPGRAQFEALTNQMFRVRDAAGRSGELRLLGVRAKASRQGLEQFSLVLRGERGRPIEGGLYRMEHPGTGAFDLRLDGSGRDAAGLLYRADFSLLV